MRHPHVRESDLVIICEKCKQPHGSDFTSEFSGHKHYLCVVCQECGHIMSLQTERMNSGHVLENGVLKNNSELN